MNDHLMPAFSRDHAHDGHNGMTLRDYFAAKAMAAVWSKLDPDSVRDLSLTQTAKTAYMLADAMLKARQSVSPELTTEAAQPELLSYEEIEAIVAEVRAKHPNSQHAMHYAADRAQRAAIAKATS